MGFGLLVQKSVWWPAQMEMWVKLIWCLSEKHKKKVLQLITQLNHFCFIFICSILSAKKLIGANSTRWGHLSSVENSPNETKETTAAGTGLNERAEGRSKFVVLLIPGELICPLAIWGGKRRNPSLLTDERRKQTSLLNWTAGNWWTWTRWNEMKHGMTATLSYNHPFPFSWKFHRFFVCFRVKIAAAAIAGPKKVSEWMGCKWKIEKTPNWTGERISFCLDEPD